MNSVHTISGNMDRIRRAFEYGDDLIENEEDIKSIVNKLQSIDIEFRSIAFEAVSMRIALKVFSDEVTISSWFDFLRTHAMQHIVQVHVGLGWAIAQCCRPVLPVLKMIEPNMQRNVVDGCGYYHGMFRGKQTVKLRVIPKEFQNEMSTAFDQGIGRSIWYICKGEIEKSTKMIKDFNSERQAALWRGLGVAAIFVGACNENVLKELFQSAGKYRSQLVIGAIQTAKSRILADAMTKDVELACNIWCNLSVHEVLALTQLPLQTKEMTDSDRFETWISNIEKNMVSI